MRATSTRTTVDISVHPNHRMRLTFWHWYLDANEERVVPPRDYHPTLPSMRRLIRLAVPNKHGLIEVPATLYEQTAGFGATLRFDRP